MKVVIKELDITNKRATITFGDTTAVTKVVIPANKGAEEQCWIDLRPFADKFGEGEHKRWLTVSRKEEDEIGKEYDTLKHKRLPNYISILNLMNYVSAEEYEQARKIFAKAERKLIPEKFAAKMELTDFQVALLKEDKANESK